MSDRSEHTKLDRDFYIPWSGASCSIDPADSAPDRPANSALGNSGCPILRDIISSKVLGDYTELARKIKTTSRAFGPQSLHKRYTQRHANECGNQLRKRDAKRQANT